jgi:hypothetical protein
MFWRWLVRWWRRRSVDYEMVQAALAHERAHIRTSDDWRDRELL